MNIDTRAHAAAQDLRHSYKQAEFSARPPGRHATGPVRALLAAVVVVAVGLGMYTVLGNRDEPLPVAAAATLLEGPLVVTYQMTYEVSPGSLTTGTFVWTFDSYSDWTWEQTCCDTGTGTAKRVTPDGVTWARFGTDAKWEATGTFDPAEGQTPLPELAPFDPDRAGGDIGVPADAQEAVRVADLGDVAAVYEIGTMQVIFDATNGLPVYAWGPVGDGLVREILAIDITRPNEPINTGGDGGELPPTPLGMIAVGATNGEAGYAYTADMNAADASSQVSTPAEAEAYMDRLNAGLEPMPPPVPVYTVDGTSVIGYFSLDCDLCVYNPPTDKGRDGLLLMTPTYAERLNGEPPPEATIADDIAQHPDLTDHARAFFAAVAPASPTFYDEHTGGDAVEIILEAEGTEYGIDIYPAVPAEDVFPNGVNAAVSGRAAALVDWGQGQYELRIAGRDHVYLIRNVPAAETVNSATGPIVSIAEAVLHAFEPGQTTANTLVDPSTAMQSGSP